MPLFKLPFEANFPISTPLAGHAQPPAERSEAGTWTGVVATTGGALVPPGDVVFAGAGVPAGRRVTVVLLEGEVEVTTREPLLVAVPEPKRIAWPGRMV